MIEPFVLSDKYLTGDPLIDSEHHELVRLINSLVNYEAGVDDQKNVQCVLEALTNYAVCNFSHEESLMLEAGCDSRHIQLHQSSHARFKRQLMEMLGDSAGRVDTELVFRFLTHWLGNHICCFDKALATQIALIRSGSSPAEAFMNAHENIQDDPAGSLQEALSNMRNALAIRNVELAKLNQGLEKEISERTYALRLANANLISEQNELQQRYAEISDLNQKLNAAQEQLLQSEKLASIGQLAAGVAHEINNPIGFVHSNIGSLEKYIQDVFHLLAAYEQENPALLANDSIHVLRRQIDIDFLKEDIPVLIKETKDGLVRVKKIVQDLKDFSRVDSNQIWEFVDLHQGIDSTLGIVANEIRYKADVVREYGALPQVECLPSQLNQVFMNLLVNAAHAIGNERGCITIRTGSEHGSVWLEFADTGQGMSPDIKQRIFEPFFTTKPVGQGTGLGLSLSYGIIQKHHGNITVNSTPGVGTCFRINLPVTQEGSDGVNVVEELP